MTKSNCRFIIAILISFMYLPIMAQPLVSTNGIPYQWKYTDTTKRNVKLSEFKIVLPRYTFPEINFPEFMDKEQGYKQFFEHEPVIAVEINGKAKAYPLNILTMHEMSNDELDTVPILPTYCPLCNASVVYDRRITYLGKPYTLNFEVSGMLRHSDMVMADKETESFWQQLTGQCMVGKFTGIELNVIPSLVISVKEFFERYPDGKILSPYTGTESAESYGQNPYVGYDAIDGKPMNRYFNHKKIDDRLPAMERVVDFRVGNNYKVYPFSVLSKACVINDKFKGEKVVIFYSKETVSVLDQGRISDSRAIGSATLFSPIVDGKALKFKKGDDFFIDTNTESKWDITGRCVEGKYKGKNLTPLPHSNHFAFAFLNFYPESEIYKE